MVDAGQLTGLLGPWIEHCSRRAAAWIPNCEASWTFLSGFMKTQSVSRVSMLVC